MYHTKLNAAEEPAARPRNILKILYEHTHTHTHACKHAHSSNYHHPPPCLLFPTS